MIKDNRIIDLKCRTKIPILDFLKSLQLNSILPKFALGYITNCNQFYSKAHLLKSFTVLSGVLIL